MIRWTSVSHTTKVNQLRNNIFILTWWTEISSLQIDIYINSIHHFNWYFTESLYFPQTHLLIKFHFEGHFMGKLKFFWKKNLHLKSMVTRQNLDITRDWPESNKKKTYFAVKLIIDKSKRSIKFQATLIVVFSSSMYSAFTLILNSFLWYLPQEYFYYFWSSAMQWGAKVIQGHPVPKKINAIWCLLKLFFLAKY